jgi:hypothetical protein
MHFNELSEYINNKITYVISIMRKTRIKEYSIYKNLDDVTLLNLSFRSGDELHCQWTRDEENLLLPILVSYGNKPVSTIGNTI